jgi:hypothetical protein
MNIDYTLRLSPCRRLTGGGESEECIPAPDYVDPVAVASTARAREIAAAILHDPDSSTPAHDWRTATITTPGHRHFQRGENFVLRWPDGSSATGIIRDIIINCTVEAGTMQMLVVSYRL